MEQSRSAHLHLVRSRSEPDPSPPDESLASLLRGTPIDSPASPPYWDDHASTAAVAAENTPRDAGGGATSAHCGHPALTGSASPCPWCQHELAAASLQQGDIERARTLYGLAAAEFVRLWRV